MSKRIIDAHVHLEMYKDNERTKILAECESYGVDALITVSFHLESAQENLELARGNKRIKPCIGFHPEQPVPSEGKLSELFQFLEEQQNEIVAIGEVGLPYYLRQEQPELPLEPYVTLLEQFIISGKRLDLPIALHAVYDDAPIVCSLLEKHSVQKAHFHWFKGDLKTIERMKDNGYFISITPDVVYEQEIQEIVQSYPLTQMMVETDGPWPFEGPFEDKMTHPKMIRHSIEKIAKIKQVDVDTVYEQMYQNTKMFYGI